MKSWNLNLKRSCGKCNDAKERKRIRLDREDSSGLEEDNENLEDGENNSRQRGCIDNPSSSDDCTDDDDDDQDVETNLGLGVTKKRKRSGENHTHCHCPLFEVSDSLVEFMSAGQPSQKYKKDLEKRRNAAKVERVLLVQRRKMNRTKYERDLRTEVTRFKQASRMAVKDIASSHELQVYMYIYAGAKTIFEFFFTAV